MRESEVGFVVLGIILAVIGVASGIAQLLGYGIPGIIASLALVLAVTIACMGLLRPVLVPNLRGVIMLRAIAMVGLVDVEDRNNDLHALPPAKIYKAARREIAITAITAFRSFDQGIGDIIEALDVGKRVYFLILHPDSPDVQRVTGNEDLSIELQIATVLDRIHAKDLARYPNFKIKFTRELLPFTVVMIDGDIAAIGTPADRQAQIRIQPRTASGTQHKGVVLQFKKRRGHAANAFDYFADDVRKQWRDAEELLF
jgi:hypothetical protein